MKRAGVAETQEKMSGRALARRKFRCCVDPKGLDCLGRQSTHLGVCTALLVGFAPYNAATCGGRRRQKLEIMEGAQLVRPLGLVPKSLTLGTEDLEERGEWQEHEHTTRTTTRASKKSRGK